jgi:hypothetical protein
VTAADEPARPCNLPHHDFPESTCTQPAAHTGPHGSPLIINGRQCGAVAWDSDRQEQP